MLDQILDLIALPPGSLVYHFIILFAIEAALAMAFGQWMRDRASGTARLWIAISVIFAARIFLLLAALATWQGLLPRDVLIPPVERFVDTATVIGLFWAFITMDDPEMFGRNFVPDVVAVAMMGVGLIALLGTYYFWSSSQGVTFNGLWIDIIWAVSQVVMIGVGLLWMLTRIRYVYDGVLKATMLIIIGASAVYHLIDPNYGDVAAALRLGQIVAMPMLAAVAYRHVVEQLLHWDEFIPTSIQPQANVATSPSVRVPTMESKVPQEIPPGVYDETIKSLTPIPEADEDQQLSPEPLVTEVVESIGLMIGTLSAADIVRQAPRAVATALHADVAMLAVVNDSMEQAAIVGVYDNISQSFLDESIIDLSEHPTITSALGRLKQMKLTTSRNAQELQDIYDRVGITHIGPAYIEPLTQDDQRIGVLIVGLPYSGRQLSEGERNLLDRLASLVTSAMLSVEKHEDLLEESQQSLASESARMVSLSDELTARNAELNEMQRKMEEMKAYVRDAYRRTEEADNLRQEYEQLKQAMGELEALRHENDALAARIDDLAEGATPDEADELKKTLNDLEAENVRLQAEAERVNELQQELEKARSDFAQTDAYAARTEIIALRARLTEATISQQEVSFLQEQLAAKARDIVMMQTRLMEAQAVAEALREQINLGIGSSRNMQSLQTQIQNQQNELDALRKELMTAQDEAGIGPVERAIQKEIDANDRAAMTQLEAQLAERGALINALEKQLSDKSRAIMDLREQLTEIEPALRDVERQLASKNAEVERLQTSLDNTQLEAQHSIEAMNSAAQRGEQEKVEEYRVQVEDLRRQIEEKTSAIQLLESQLDSTRVSMQDLENQLSEANTAVESAIGDGGEPDSHDEVIASIAQELRTPMSSIIGYTDVLLREQVGILGSLQRKFLQRVKSNTERMGALLDDLIRVTTMDRGRWHMTAEKVDIVYAFEETMTNLANQYREKGLTVRMLFAEGVPAVTADTDSILQIFNHLMLNAALASPVQGEVQITITADQGRVMDVDGGPLEAPCVHITVEDSGRGVDEADIERVFARKYRADNPLIEGIGDTGVGLALTQALIESHYGRIWLESSSGAGTTFHVLLPLEPPGGNGAA